MINVDWSVCLLLYFFVFVCSFYFHINFLYVCVNQFSEQSLLCLLLLISCLLVFLVCSSFVFVFEWLFLFSSSHSYLSCISFVTSIIFIGVCLYVCLYRLFLSVYIFCVFWGVLSFHSLISLYIYVSSCLRPRFLNTELSLSIFLQP